MSDILIIPVVLVATVVVLRVAKAITGWQPKGKRYCNGCKFGSDKACYHSNNVELARSYAECDKIPIKHPSELNPNNDCPWYRDWPGM